MNNENNLNASDIVSSTSVENVANTNEGETNESMNSTNIIQNENITDEGNKEENVSTFNTNTSEGQVDNSNIGGCSTSNLEIDKPIETYKKVKLKRSHILKKLSTSVTVNIQPNSSTDTEQSTRSNETTPENTSSNPLNIDIPEDNISTSFDLDINDASSNSDSTCSPTPRKKVKLIRNNPRFKSNIIKTSPVVSTVKDECEVTTSSSPKISNEFTISQTVASELEENVTLNDPKSNIDVKSAYKMHPDNDIEDVVAQIDQIIGPDDGTVPSTSFLDTDDLSLSDGFKNDDLSIIEELEKEINDIPPTNESSNDVIEKIVDDLDEIRTKNEQTQNLVETTFENTAQTEIIEALNQSEDLTLEENSECQKEVDFSTEVEKQQVNDEDYNIDLDDKVESVDDLEKKLLDVSAQVDSLDCSEGMEVDEILDPVPQRSRVEDFSTNSDIHSIILSDNNLQNLEISGDVENTSDNIENIKKLPENIKVNPKNTDHVEESLHKGNLEIPEKIPAKEIISEVLNISSSENQNIHSSVEVISSSSDQNNDLPTTSSVETSEFPKITLTIKKSEIKKPVENKCEIEEKSQNIRNVDSTNVEMRSEFQSEQIMSSSDIKRVPKLTIKPIKKPSNETETKLTIKTVKPQSENLESQVINTLEFTESKSTSTPVISSTLEAIPKLTIRNIKKSQDEDLEVVQSTSTDTVEKEVVPKLTIKPLKKPAQQSNLTQIHVVTSEIKKNTPEVIPKLTIKTKIIPTEEHQQPPEPTSTVESIPKLTIKTGNKIETVEKDIKQCPNIDSSNLESNTQIEESLPKITIKNTPDKSFEIIPNASISLSEESSADESVDYTSNISAANKSSLAAANMELIPRSMKNKNRTQTIDSDDEEIEVIPSVSDKNSSEFVPKLSIKALKKSLQSDKEMGNHPEEPSFKSIPTSTSSKLIIKPIVNAPNLSKIKKIDNSLASQSLLKTVDISESKDYGTLLKNNQKRDESITETTILNTKSPSRKMINIPGNKSHDDEEMSSKNDRIVLKINKDNELMRSHLKSENTLNIDTTSSPLEKITLKLSKEGGHPEILSPSSFSKTMPTTNPSLKRMLSPETTIEPIQMDPKKKKPNETSIEFSSGDISINIIKSSTSTAKKLQSISDDVTIVRVPSETPQPTKIELGNNSSKLKDILMKFNVNRMESSPQDDGDSSSSDDVKIVEVISPAKLNVDPLSISNDESSSQDVMILDEILPDPMEELKPDLPAVPKKRGRPRKIPLEVRPELKEEEPDEPVITVNELPIEDSPAPSPAQPSDEDDSFEMSPNRGYNIRGIRRGGAYRSRRGRGGRGSRGGRGAYKRRAEEKRRALMDLQSVITSDVTVALDKLDVDKKSLLKMKPDGSAEAFLMEEDTRMSADGELGETGTHIKPEITDESRSSSTTTENNRNKRGRLEITEIEVFKHVTGPEQIAEYHWRNGGPYMLQEQIAQYLGVKSFKRKYPGLTRHAVEMQERDYIRENGLASEALCDMGLTAVLSSEILDIMFTDFQDKYEEYRKYQREKQAKDVTNKQRAMASSMATNADRGDKEESVLQKAIRSAASWNASLNKSRKEERKCYLDLQSFAVMYPRGRKPVAQNTNPGDYPVALVPGQFSEFYKNYSHTELKYLPVNTVLYGPIVQNASIQEIGYSDGSCSESESSSGSDSESSEDSDSTTMDGITTPLTNPPTLNTESDTCKICITSSPKSRPGKSSLIYCAQCNGGIHPRCIDLTVEMMPFIQAYPWQCTDCKTCWQCRRPSDDDKMLFCDRCDRGYHIYCVGLRKVPNGRWHCQQCTMTTATNTAITHSVSVAT